MYLANTKGGNHSTLNREVKMNFREFLRQNMFAHSWEALSKNTKKTDCEGILKDLQEAETDLKAAIKEVFKQKARFHRK